VRARVAKRDNFVVAVFNINENVSPAFSVDSASPSEETAVALHRKSFTNFDRRPLCLQRRIYGKLKIINYAKR
jgi:hypothetical protein